MMMDDKKYAFTVHLQSLCIVRKSVIYAQLKKLAILDFITFPRCIF